jgi:hypothetical protein
VRVRVRVRVCVCVCVCVFARFRRNQQLVVLFVLLAPHLNLAQCAVGLGVTALASIPLLIGDVHASAVTRVPRLARAGRDGQGEDEGGGVLVGVAVGLGMQVLTSLLP